MKNEQDTYQQYRIGLNKTVFESAPGRNLEEATKNLRTDEACFFEGVARFELLSARRISTSFRVEIDGHEGEFWEVWEFEIFTHADGGPAILTTA